MRPCHAYCLIRSIIDKSCAPVHSSLSPSWTSLCLDIVLGYGYPAVSKYLGMASVAVVMVSNSGCYRWSGARHNLDLILKRASCLWH